MNQNNNYAFQYDTVGALADGLKHRKEAALEFARLYTLNNKSDKQLVIRVNYEALGVLHVAFTDELDIDWDEIRETIQLINPTAVISSICTDVVSPGELSDWHLNNLKVWSDNIDKRFESYE